MKRPTPSPEDARDLIARCLQLYEERGPGAVDEVLAEHPDSSAFVRERLDLLGRMGLVGEAPADSLPERIGSYRITGLLGRGGMGVVYAAEQERPRRSVALKVLRSWPGEKGRSRFQLEAELLARLQHPGIAAIYEAGTAAVGGLTVSFFALELVRGVPIDCHANEQGLDARARLALLAEICDAVHHAHLKGVVHRDLKPANVLVDERGRPRVLDFGIARTIDPDLELETLRTEVGQLVGTLAYMSPEQAAGNPAEIDARSDVYSLGVLGYELLSGRLPVEVTERTSLDALQAIRDVEPPPLGRLDRGLRGDIETIVSTALAKEKERRYGSAHELAADIRRYLANEPIAARPATAGYQLLKYARRHRVLVGAVAAVAAALVLGLFGTAYGLVQASRERDEAERRFRQASAVLDFQGHMFTSAEGVQVEDLLDRSALMLKASVGDPLEDAAIRVMLGKAFRGVGRYDTAEELVAAAAATFERELGLEDLRTLAARTELASLRGHPMGLFDAAETALDGVVETALRIHGPAHDVTLDARLVRAELLRERGRPEEAIAIARDVERLAGPARSQWTAARRQLARTLSESGEIEAAIALARELHEWHLETYGREDPRTWSAMDALAGMLQRHGRLEEGVPLTEELLALRTRFLGAEHPNTLDTRTNVGLGHYYSWELERAEQVVREALAAGEARYAAGHPSRLFALNALGVILTGQGKAAEAEPVLRESLERTRELRGSEHLDTLAAMSNLAHALRQLQRLDEAEELYVQALEIRRRTRGARHPATVLECSFLGKFYTRSGRYDEADSLLQAAVEIGREVLGADSAHLDGILLSLGNNLLLQKRYPESEVILLECLELQTRAEPEGSPAQRGVLTLLEMLYSRWGKPEQAAVYAALLAGN